MSVDEVPARGPAGQGGVLPCRARRPGWECARAVPGGPGGDARWKGPVAGAAFLAARSSSTRGRHRPPDPAPRSGPIRTAGSGPPDRHAVAGAGTGRVPRAASPPGFRQAVGAQPPWPGRKRNVVLATPRPVAPCRSRSPERRTGGTPRSPAGTALFGDRSGSGVARGTGGVTGTPARPVPSGCRRSCGA
ncbi:Hypothetical protein SCLAV_0387 [Streptomyces clavuligerus]|uniref:Uncharacterized protein n=1 Tax=Streptomyces clavuligerus TaxID=1901 RepID=E2Q8D1_STRCL|nr:Hypothetical protein SCLAV_0387 [Streptomyces clavuligerus]